MAPSVIIVKKHRTAISTTAREGNRKRSPTAVALPAPSRPRSTSSAAITPIDMPSRTTPSVLLEKPKRSCTHGICATQSPTAAPLTKNTPVVAIRGFTPYGLPGGKPRDGTGGSRPAFFVACVQMATTARTFAAIPPETAEVLRPVVSDLSDETIAAIAEEVPDYARAMEGDFGRAVRRGVEIAFDRFLQLVADPNADIRDASATSV